MDSVDKSSLGRSGSKDSDEGTMVVTSTKAQSTNWTANLEADKRLYFDVSKFGERYWHLRHAVSHTPLEAHVDVSLVCKIIVETTIVFNCFQLGLCTHPESDTPLDKMCTTSDFVFTSVFTLEFLYKVAMIRWAYFAHNWNRFDVGLLIITYVDACIFFVDQGAGIINLRQVLILKLLRLLRILRILRVLQHKIELRMVLEGLVASFQSMFWVAGMLGLLIYVASIICVTFFREVSDISVMDAQALKQLSEEDLSIAESFSTIPRAMFTLFTLAIVADWTPIVSPVTNRYWWSAFFFVGFTVAATFGTMNLIIGVITERTSQVQQNYREMQAMRKDGQRLENIKEIAEIMFAEIDSHGDDPDEATITKEKMDEFVKSEKFGHHIHQMMDAVSLPHGYQLTDCHAMFDRDASGTITQQEFVQGMGRLIFGNDFQRSCMVQSSIADVLMELKRVEMKLSDRFDQLDAKLDGRSSVAVEPTRPSPPQSHRDVVKQAASAMLSAVESSDAKWSASDREIPHEMTPRAFLPQDLPSCRALVERLREPLAMLLADDLSAKATIVAKSAALQPAAITSQQPGTPGTSIVGSGDSKWARERRESSRQCTPQDTSQPDQTLVSARSNNTTDADDIVHMVNKLWGPEANMSVRAEV